jgi:hypothetical protein
MNPASAQTYPGYLAPPSTPGYPEYQGYPGYPGYQGYAGYPPQPTQHEISVNALQTTVEAPQKPPPHPFTLLPLDVRSARLKPVFQGIIIAVILLLIQLLIVSLALRSGRDKITTSMPKNLAIGLFCSLWFFMILPILALFILESNPPYLPSVCRGLILALGSLLQTCLYVIVGLYTKGYEIHLLIFVIALESILNAIIMKLDMSFEKMGVLFFLNFFLLPLVVMTIYGWTVETHYMIVTVPLAMCNSIANMWLINRFMSIDYSGATIYESCLFTITAYGGILILLGLAAKHFGLNFINTLKRDPLYVCCCCCLICLSSVKQ